MAVGRYCRARVLSDIVPVVFDVFLPRDRQDAHLDGFLLVGAGGQPDDAGLGTRIMQRQEQRKSAPLSKDTGQLDFATEEHRELTTDRKS